MRHHSQAHGRCAMNASKPIRFPEVELNAVEHALTCRIKELEARHASDPEYWDSYLVAARSALKIVWKTKYPSLTDADHARIDQA